MDLLRSVARGIHVRMLDLYAPEIEPDRLDVEIGYLVRERPEEDSYEQHGPELTLRELPATARLATCVRIRLPEHAHLITEKIGRWVEANGNWLAGPSRELFLQPPRPDRMAESVVEMQFPIEGEARAYWDTRPRSLN
jgi:effector-binding domain-containing protein